MIHTSEALQLLGVSPEEAEATIVKAMAAMGQSDGMASCATITVEDQWISCQLWYVSIR